MSTRTAARLLAGACAIALVAAVSTGLMARGQGQAPSAAVQAGARGGRAAIGPQLFPVFDANGDGSLTAAELKATFDKWYTGADSAKSGSISQAQLAGAINATMPVPPPAPATPPAASAGAPAVGGGQPGGGAGRGAGGAPAAASAANQATVWGTSAPGLTEACGGRSQQPTAACQKDIDAMMKALPGTAPAKPARPRKVLIWSRLPSSGYQHSSIPLAAKTVEEIGKKTGAWTSDASWDPGVFTAENLKQYDAIFLSSTTGCFLDDASNEALTLARRQALLDFVRGGKGIAGIHATGDSYHGGGPNCIGTGTTAGGAAGAGGGARGGGGAGAGGALAPVLLRWAWAVNDKKLVSNDLTMTKADVDAVSDAWFKMLDADKTGKISQETFNARIGGMVSTQEGTAPHVGRAGRDTGRGSWPDWDSMIGGFFKFHWYDPQPITVKIDDPKSPLTAMFNGQEFEAQDETYTFSVNSFSRENVHVLTSIDYDKMSFVDKLKESNPRPDHDYGLSWIKKDGQGRVFYMALGHSERIYAMNNMMAHLTAGMQYVLGDLKADDSPSVKKK